MKTFFLAFVALDAAFTWQEKDVTKDVTSLGKCPHPMLLFWDFQHRPSKSEIILYNNLCLINILFKGRSASLRVQDEIDMKEDEMEITDKERCDLINIGMLSNESFSYSGTPDGDSCIMSYDELSNNYNVTIKPYTIKDCDCSDPENYEFLVNKGRF